MNIMVVTAYAADIGYENEEKACETFRLYARVKQIAMDMVRQGMGFGMAEQYQFV